MSNNKGVLAGAGEKAQEIKDVTVEKICNAGTAVKDTLASGVEKVKDTAASAYETVVGTADEKKDQLVSQGGMNIQEEGARQGR
ncbi:hypothetical protein COOONC_03871 [Cooperia oncophora]